MSRTTRVIVLRSAIGLCAFAIWQWAYLVPGLARLPVFDPFIVSTPTAIATALADLVVHRELLAHVGYTLGATAAGIAAGVALGGLTALVFANVPMLSRIVDPFLHLFNSVPRIVIAPYLLIALGIGVAPRIVMAWSFVFFLVYFNVQYGLTRIPAASLNHILMLGGSWLDVVRSLHLPIATAWTLRAFPHAVAYGFVGTVFQEFMGGDSGIGSVMIQGLNELNSAVVMGMVALLALLGWLLVSLGEALGRAFAPWLRGLGV